MIDSSSLSILEFEAAPESGEQAVNAALGELERIADEAGATPAAAGFNKVLGNWMLRNPAAAARLLVVSLGNAQITETSK